MPSGKVHDAVNLALLPFAILTPEPFEPLMLTAGYLVGTLLLSPDLDLSSSRVAMRWGLLRAIWLPYAKVAAHRRISHVPIVGLTVRMTYICIFVGLVLALLTVCGIKIDLNPKGMLLRHAFSFALGMFIADTLHIALDVLVSSAKKLMSK
ncbi:MAG: DUF2227 family putative metal-binding protein [Armatimonadota bacterium]|nr:DUF2227 family putative metal-binding protein [Armatimonadota bacterium]MCX7778345.1 DUF2227 family putative metal-binding protein [Armatimonadota bacterium]MDW8026403.1 DUF2227 family putative metal-binding protein [Armatimonadota bacterium]